MHKSHEVSPTNALAMIQKGEGVLIDIREPKEVANKSFDVSNIKLIPLTELKTRFHEIPGDRPVIIACHSGSRSFMATRFLFNHGYTQALNLQQGIVRWEKEGLPVKHAPKQQSGSLLRRFFIGKS